jgi:hypothetical protein
VVSGRRRQGKSYLLEALCSATGGFDFVATEATEAESLRQLAEAVAHYLDMPAAPSLRDGEQRLKERTSSRARLVLCGSSMTFMGGLLSGSAPLRGRAGLDLTVPTLDYRAAAGFWGIDDSHLAVRVHSIVGGTPAYHREYTSGDAPAGADDFDAWVVRTVLNPASPLFKEARYLLSEEPRNSDLVVTGRTVLAAEFPTDIQARQGVDLVRRLRHDVDDVYDLLNDTNTVAPGYAARSWRWCSVLPRSLHRWANSAREPGGRGSRRRGHHDKWRRGH